MNKTRLTIAASFAALAALAMVAADLAAAGPIETGQMLHRWSRSERENRATKVQPSPAPTADAKAEIFCHTGSPPPCPPPATVTEAQQAPEQPAAKVDPNAQVNRPKPD